MDVLLAMALLYPVVCLQGEMTNASECQDNTKQTNDTNYWFKAIKNGVRYFTRIWLHWHGIFHWLIEFKLVQYLTNDTNY